MILLQIEFLLILKVIFVLFRLVFVSVVCFFIDNGGWFVFFLEVKYINFRVYVVFCLDFERELDECGCFVWLL